MLPLVADIKKRYTALFGTDLAMLSSTAVTRSRFVDWTAPFAIALVLLLAALCCCRVSGC